MRTCEAIVTGAEGQVLVLSPHTGPLQGAPEGAAAEGQDHQGMNRVNILDHTNISHLLPAVLHFVHNQGKGCEGPQGECCCVR
jgi:hypothetical protein